MDCECFGSTTFKRQEMNFGIEPDECFYIQNHHTMIGKDRLNLAIDPPPDLAIEVDVTSQTQVEAYTRLGVPELWVYGEAELTIYVLQSGQYQRSEGSAIFPNLPILAWIEHHPGEKPSPTQFPPKNQVIAPALGTLMGNPISLPIPRHDI